MARAPERHNRRSIRLRNYDYARAGAYFVTICTHGREQIFGDVVDGAMQLSGNGMIVESEILRSASVRQEIEIRAYVVMPDHFHALIAHHGCDPAGRVDRSSPICTSRGPRLRSLGALIAGFKCAVTTSINTIRSTPGWPVWQRGYYERIIRDDAHYQRVVDYIANNPRRWRAHALSWRPGTRRAPHRTGGDGEP